MRFTSLRLLAGFMLLSLVSSVSDADETPQAPKKDVLNAPAPVSKVVKVSIKNSADPTAVGLNDNLVIHVDNLGAWKPASEPKPKIVPYLNGIAIRGNYPFSINYRDNTIAFILKRQQEANTDNRDAWTTLLRRPNPIEYYRTLEVTVGTEDGKDILAVDVPKGEEPRLVVLPWWWWWMGVALVVMAAGLIYFAVSSNILRDSDLEPFQTGERRPFSLARTQMAVWFLVIIVSYSVIWAITGDLGNIPETVLGLMGISGVTAVAAVTIDAGRQAERRKSLAENRQQIESLITQRQAELAGATEDGKSAAQRNLADAKKILEDLNPKSRGFLTDILSDSDGVSFHRFQIAAWTLALGAIFIATVYNTLAMPAFSGFLLGLMGISAGTYLGFKVPEAKKP